MGAKPSGPWRRLADGEPCVDLGPYEAAPHLFKYAVLYQAVARVSGGAIGPETVNQWESWQCAAYLGVGLPTPDEAQPGAEAGVSPVMAKRIEWLEARAKGEEIAPPEPEVPTGDAGAALMAAFLPGGPVSG